MQEFFFTAPYPPSVNHYWLTRGRYKFLSDKARAFATNVAKLLPAQTTFFGTSLVSLEIAVYPPDKRKRDIDNILKPILDALAKAGVYTDDSQVHKILIYKCEPCKNGKIEIKIKKL